MSLNKSIVHGKERRKPYQGAKAIDRACWNHGSFWWCKGNRIYNSGQREDQQAQKLKEYMED